MYYGMSGKVQEGGDITKVTRIGIKPIAKPMLLDSGHNRQVATIYRFWTYFALSMDLLINM